MSVSGIRSALARLDDHRHAGPLARRHRRRDRRPAIIRTHVDAEALGVAELPAGLDRRARGAAPCGRGRAVPRSPTPACSSLPELAATCRPAASTGRSPAMRTSAP